MKKRKNPRKTTRNKFKAAIIGCGNIGCDLDKYKPGFVSTHLSAYKKNPMTDIVALCDINLEKAKRVAAEKKISHVFQDVKELMIETQPEIVSICTPDETHHTILKEVLKFKCVKGIWCEKPLAVSIKQGKEMVDLCKKRNIKLLINHIRRYDNFYIQIKRDINKILGKIQNVTCYYSGGIVTTGSHVLDLMNYFFGDCVLLLGHKSSINEGIFAELLYKNGIHVNLVPCDNKYFSIMEVSIIGSKAKLELINLPFGNYEYRYFITEKDNKTGAKYIGRKSKNIIKRNIKRDFIQAALQDLIDSIDKKQDPISSGSAGLKALELLSAICWSADHNGSVVNFPFNNPNFRIPQAQGDVKKWKS